MTTDAIQDQQRLLEDHELEALVGDPGHERWDTLTPEEAVFVRDELDGALMAIGCAVERLRQVRETFNEGR